MYVHTRVSYPWSAPSSFGRSEVINCGMRFSGCRGISRFLIYTTRARGIVSYANDDDGDHDRGII